MAKIMIYPNDIKWIEIGKKKEKGSDNGELKWSPGYIYKVERDTQECKLEDCSFSLHISSF